MRWKLRAVRAVDDLYEMDGTNLVSESHGWTVWDGWYKSCLWEPWMNCMRWMVQTLSLRAMDELYEMDGTNLVSKSQVWTVRDGWYKPCLWEPWMNSTRRMVQTLSLRAMDELYEMDGTNLVSKAMDELYEMDGTNLVSESHGWTARDGWCKPCLWEPWMNSTRRMVQTLSLRAMAIAPYV